ncbi:MAG: DUF4388 domain-containing protein [Acidobacteriota bacterium]
MTTKSTIEQQGKLSTYPFAELAVEIAQARLSGSLRLSFETKKTIVYFKNGEVVYAVSNARAHRLFSILLDRKKLETNELSAFPEFANDIEFAAALATKGRFTSEQLASLKITQIEEIIVDALLWPSGEWVFSPLSRIRDDMQCMIDIHKLMMDYARCIPSSVISQRFKSVNEAFSSVGTEKSEMHLQSHEAFALSKFNGRPMTLEDLRVQCPMPEAGLSQALYVLWLSGLIYRHDWNAAFSPSRIAEIGKAKLSRLNNKLKTPTASTVSSSPDGKPVQAAPRPEEKTTQEPTVEMSLEEYLEQVEKAETLYDILGIDEKADIPRIKHQYFGMARLFHPDRYHRESAGILRRIQVAFTELAHAYETLKSPPLRETYDFKMRKEMEGRKRRIAEGHTEVSSLSSEQGLESFEQGLNMLADEEFEAAATYLSRAIHYNPQNALYHAYYGKALSADPKQRHKAESEMQNAVKLDPKDPKIRLMLVEFFIDNNLAKRAEGELKRFLEIAPNNREAKKLLDKILQ